MLIQWIFYYQVVLTNDISKNFKNLKFRFERKAYVIFNFLIKFKLYLRTKQGRLKFILLIFKYKLNHNKTQQINKSNKNIVQLC